MATLHVRNVPDDLYEEMQRRAREERRSLSSKVVALLEFATEHQRRQANLGMLLDDIRRNRYTPPAGTPDAVDLLREDRER